MPACTYAYPRQQCVPVGFSSVSSRFNGDRRAVTPEAVGFLSAVGIFVVLLAILFLFINKKLCFARVGGLPCLEQYSRRKRRDRAGIHQGLGMADVPQAGLSSWFAQISDAFSNGFRHLGQNGAVDSEVSVKDESSEVEQNLRVVHGSGVDQGSRFDYASSAERLTPISEETDELESRRSLLASRCSDAVNTYGDDGENSSSSDSDDELAKQFKISVSRSQSFRLGVTELNTQNAPGQHHKFKRLPSDQEEGSTEPSDCEATYMSTTLNISLRFEPAL
ncbi:hypothetical protein cypCar_00015675 [Cyprinus carpio]|nr:hypothetical protein cypCar_00015675 [Cyprinus carpio]